MHRTIRSGVALLALTAVAALPAAASAKTQKVTIKSVGGQDGIKLTAKMTGSLGSCTMKGQLIIPDTHQVWTCKGGTLKVTGHGTTGAADDSKGTWKVTGGTGRFKGAGGGGTFSGQLSTGKYTYVGTIRS